MDVGSTAVEVGSAGDSVIVSVGGSLDTIPVSTGRSVAVMIGSIVAVGPSVNTIEVAMLQNTRQRQILREEQETTVDVRFRCS